MDVLTTPQTSRAELLEQVMRITGDDLTLFPFIDAAPRSRDAHTAIGRLLTEAPVPLVAGCPLYAWATGTVVDPSWRSSYPPRSESLWAHLEFLRAMSGADLAAPPELGGDPYAELEALRASSDDTFAPLN